MAIWLYGYIVGMQATHWRAFQTSHENIASKENVPFSLVETEFPIESTLSVRIFFFFTIANISSFG